MQRIEITPPARTGTTLTVGDTVTLIATAFDGDDNPVSGTEFGWSSSDESVMRVTQTTGRVTVLAAGSATITAGGSNRTGSILLRSVDADLAAVQAEMSSDFVARVTPKLSPAGQGAFFAVVSTCGVAISDRNVLAVDECLQSLETQTTNALDAKLLWLLERVLLNARDLLQL